MADYSDADARRPVILYIIIAIALCVALVVGVWWAKIRSADYAQQSGQQQTAQNSQPQGSSSSQDASQPPQQSPASSSNSETPTSAPQQTAASQTPASASRVPATGPEQPFLQVLSMGAVVFAAFSYIKARRKLQNLA